MGREGLSDGWEEGINQDRHRTNWSWIDPGNRQHACPLTEHIARVVMSFTGIVIFAWWSMGTQIDAGIRVFIRHLRDVFEG
jgi:hypothetical protein